ncbi:uncharacterized protein LOC134712628 isoform X1 [Mytilus trossulus]|uniref:uncharacterized protein LOC134712628 isoform X1 n=1 Tax=Mytilus trossulus TaxID=6551 RepID=UPI003006364C
MNGRPQNNSPDFVSDFMNEIGNRPTSYSNAIQNASLDVCNKMVNGNQVFSRPKPDDACSAYAVSITHQPNSIEDNTECNKYHEIEQCAKSANIDMHRNGSTTSSSSLLLRSTRETCQNKRCIIAIICVNATIIVIAFSLIIVQFVMLTKLQDELEAEKTERKDKSNTLCLPCNDLILGPLEHDNENIKLLDSKEEDGIQVCCAKGSNQTSILMDLLFKRREKLHHTQDIIDSETNSKNNCTGDTGSNHGQDNGRIAAHLLAGVQPMTNGAPPYIIQNWDESGSTAYSSGVHVENSRIVVNTSGLYFVYSQIFFSNLYKGQTTSNTSQALYHYVYRWNVFYPNDGNELLLKSVRTQCWAENRVYGDYTSYTSGVFKLSAGDNLYVKASKLDLISRDPKASFFGIAKL